MSVRVGKIAGIENIKITAEKVGLKILDSNPQIFLGNIESDLRTITSAYTVFPNYGRRAPPFTILSKLYVNNIICMPKEFIFPRTLLYF